MHVVLGFQRRTAGDVLARQSEDVDHVIARRGQLRLREQRQQALVAAVAIDDEDFLAAVARHLLHRFLQQRELRAQAVGDGSGLLLRFEDLSEVILGENDGVFLLDGVHHGEADIEQVGAERKMRAVLLDDADGEHADSLRLVDGLHEVGGGEFFPLGGELGLRDGGMAMRREVR